MNNRPECIPCCLRRVLQTASRCTADEWLHRKVLGEVMQDLVRMDDKATPAEVMHSVARRTAKTLGVADPYLAEKRRWVEETVTNGEWIRSVVDSAHDSFLAALHLCLASNVLDCELRQDFAKGFSLKTLVGGFQEVPFSLDNVEDFRQAVQRAKRILFIHSSAGELYFDRILMEKFGKPPQDLFAAVRAMPILADATLEEAAAVGLGEVAQVVDPGSDCRGLPLNACSAEFREIYRSADLILAKGQACFETLEGRDSRIDDVVRGVFFLLRVKCPLMARHLGAAVGDCVLEPG